MILEGNQSPLLWLVDVEELEQTKNLVTMSNEKQS